MKQLHFCFYFIWWGLIANTSIVYIFMFLKITYLLLWKMVYGYLFTANICLSSKKKYIYILLPDQYQISFFINRGWVFLMSKNIFKNSKCIPPLGARMAQWVRSLDLTAHASLSPIRRGFAPSFVNYKKGALDSQPQVIKFTSCLHRIGGSLRVLRLPPPLKLVAMIYKQLKDCWKWS